MKKRSCPFFHDTGGLKKLESLSDVPRAYAGLPFSSRFLFPLPLSGEFGGLKKLESLSDVPRAYAGLPFLSLLVPASPFRGIWWAQVGSNHRPRAYQARALAC